MCTSMALCLSASRSASPVAPSWFVLVNTSVRRGSWIVLICTSFENPPEASTTPLFALMNLVEPPSSLPML